MYVLLKTMFTRGKPNYDLSLVISSILHPWQVFALLKISNTPSNRATITTDAQHHWLYKINSLVLGRCDCNFKLVILKLVSMIDILSISCEIALKGVNVIRPYGWLVNIGSVNGLVPSGNKPLPEPMLTQSSSHRENHRSADQGQQNTRWTGKPPLYNHV